MYSLTTLSDEEWQVGLDHNLIRSDMERSDINAIKSLLREERAEEAEQQLGSAYRKAMLEAEENHRTGPRVALGAAIVTEQKHGG